MKRQLPFIRFSIFFFLAFGISFQNCAPKITTTQPVNSPATVASQIDSGKHHQSIPQRPARRGEILFLGHASKHHDAGKYAPWMAIQLFKAGINLTYTNDLSDLNEDNLSKYDGLMIYANHDSLTLSQEKAMKSFVENGKGLIPVHSATGCFKNSDWYLNTIGGQFKSHGVGSFTGRIINTSHPVMKGVTEFTSWDETYVHQKINPDMTVLMERVVGDVREPYTWVRNQGKGRVFYTAYGHNDSTWTNYGFLNMVSNGVLWAIGDEVKEQIARLNIPDVSIYPDSIASFTTRHLVPKVQPALSPEESKKLIQVPVDFEVQMFATEPDITNPIAMSWDERGRLWIVESVDYPNTFLETDGAANDRIKICEDTNGDGKADKFTIFADSLNIPTSMVFANGGVVVSMAPYFIFLKDTNGDDIADVRENIMTGWEKNDTHFGPSNLLYGFDNKIWGVVGSGYNGTTKDGKTLSFRTGVYHVNPDGTGMEFLANTSNNTWGLGLSEDNNVFISTANNTHSAFYSMPAKYAQRTLEGSAVLPVQKIDGHYNVHAMTPNLRQVDVVGGFTSAAGHHLYTARSFPKEYWNRIAFICEPTVRLLHNAIIEPKGAGFTEKDGWNFLASSDEWVGPVHAEVGPDGAVWVSDWYNFIIQHNVFVPAQAPAEMVLPFKEQPRGQGNAFISALRDIDYGRIYRIVYKKSKSYTPLILKKENTPGLLAALENDNMFWRMTAQRLLVEGKDQAAIAGLYKIINEQKTDEIGLANPAVHALWTLHGFGLLEGTNAAAMQIVLNALSSKVPGIRKTAIAVLPKNNQTKEILQNSNLMNDPDLNVRMNFFLAIAALPSSVELGKLIYQATLNSENGMDEWISKALFGAAITHQEGFVQAKAKNTTAATAISLNKRISDALGQEMYNLPRRGSLSFPPDVTGKEIILKGTVSKNRQNSQGFQGFIMGQGGKEGGYGLYIRDGRLTMAVNQDGITYKATSSSAVPDSFSFVGHIIDKGEMVLEVNGRQVAKGKAPSLFMQPLVSTLRIGQDVDNENKLGDYEGNFRLEGNVQNANIELKKPGSFVASKKNIKSTATDKASTSASLKPFRVNLSVIVNILKYDKKLLTVKAGQRVIINFSNPDNMQHNLVIIQKGSLQKVGAAADAMLQDPKAAAKNYVPRMPEVLYFTRLLNVDEEVTLQFTAPSQPGDYPFVCTFPGHWRIMNGIIRVVK